ncbi:MAG: flagellar biosynthesis protein FlgB [Planctomycetota bacterium]|nr:MAG: flagellar biosynthesis protein FlgB [Planctomycetota bacterium]
MNLRAELDPFARLLDLAATQHRVIASNIANASTPGWKRRELDFDAALRAALEGGDSSHPSVRIDEESPVGPDGNSVQLERELVDLSKNTLLYQTLVRSTLSKTSMLRAAILGRGGV